MASAREKTSGKRHTIATAWNAPIDAPAAQISMSGVLAVGSDGRHDLVS